MAFLCALPALLPSRVARPYLIFSYILWAVPAILCAAHLALFKATISAQSFFAFFNAAPLQAKFFAPDYLFWHLCLAVGVCALIPARLLHRALKTPREGKLKLAPGLILCGLGILAALTLIFQPLRITRANIIYDVYTSFGDFRDYMAELREEQRNAPDKHFSNVRLTTPDDEERTLIVVVRISSSRQHYSIYNYWRNTTPGLSSISNELTIFENANNFCMEGYALRWILSPNGESNSHSIITLLNQAGFHTYLLSNQPDVDTNSVETALLGAVAHKTIYFNHGGDWYFNSSPEQPVLDSLEKILRDDPNRKAVFIYLESDAPSPLVYPPEFERFTHCSDLPEGSQLSPEDCGRLNYYDNSILNTDALLKEMIDLAERLAPESLLVYTASRGANVFNELPYIPEHESLPFEVPFFIWQSDGFRASNPDAAARWAQHTRKKIKVGDLFYTLVELSGVTFDGFDPSLSFLSDQAK